MNIVLMSPRKITTAAATLAAGILFSLLAGCVAGPRPFPSTSQWTLDVHTLDGVIGIRTASSDDPAYLYKLASETCGHVECDYFIMSPSGRQWHYSQDGLVGYRER